MAIGSRVNELLPNVFIFSLAMQLGFIHPLESAPHAKSAWRLAVMVIADTSR